MAAIVWPMLVHQGLDDVLPSCAAHHDLILDHLTSGVPGYTYEGAVLLRGPLVLDWLQAEASCVLDATRGANDGLVALVALAQEDS